MKRFLLSFLVLFIMGGAWAQITVFTDDFSTTQSATYTTSGPIGASAWSVTSGGVAGQDYGARRNTSPAQLELTNDATAVANQNGWCFASTATVSFASPYNTTLSSNSGVITWTFNMRQIRANAAGFTAGSYGVAFVLGGTSTTASTGGNGYAVVLGNTGAVDPIRLVKYTTGLISLGATLPPSANDIIVANTVGFTNTTTNYMSVKVTYTPSTSLWELFLRDDGASFADPSTGTLTSQGTAVNATYTGVSLDYLGGYWQGSTTANQTAFFDNVSVSLTLANTITTGAVTGAPFALVDCLTPSAGTVAFTSTDVFTVGNTFTAQLSDDIGSFATPVNIGSLSGPSAEGTDPSGTIIISIPAGSPSGTGYLIRVVSDMPAVTGSSSAPFQIIQVGYCVSSHTDYYRSITNGDWEVPATWESSPDGLFWITPATLAPTFNAKTILIRNADTVTIASGASADELTIQSGGELIQSNGAALALNDGAGTDMAINSGGTYVLNGTQPTGAGTVQVNSGALVRVDDNSPPSEADDFAFGNANVTFLTGCTFEWNTTITPSWAGRTYFTAGEITKYKFSQTTTFPMGGSNPTYVYGHIEANSNLTFTGTGTKTFENGIIGTGNIDASASGQIKINGTTAVLGGGTLILPATPLLIGSGTTATTTMTSSKIITGDVSFIGDSKIVLGNFNLTVSGTINGYGPTAYVQTNGTGFLKLNGIGGLRVFPVGNSDLNSVYINNGGGSDYSVRVENGINPAIAFPTYGINRTWNIFANTNTSGVEVTFWYYTADANAGVTPGTDQMEVLLYSGAAWSITPNNQNIVPAGLDPWTVTTTALGALTIGTSATPYVLGKSGGWILPIDCVIATHAQKRNNTGIISWTVNTCAEVTSFEVQRSINNSGFQTIGTVYPGVNETDFSFTDAVLSNGTNLYRIKVNRSSGASKYSNTVALIQNSNDILISSLAPNPVHNSAMITVSAGHNSVVDFKVFTMSGGLVKQWQSNIAEGNNAIQINVAELPAGTYSLFATSGDAKTVSRFVKQ